jgi:hypothetical protein
VTRQFVHEGGVRREGRPVDGDASLGRHVDDVPMRRAREVADRADRRDVGAVERLLRRQPLDRRRVAAGGRKGAEKDERDAAHAAIVAAVGGPSAALC